MPKPRQFLPARKGSDTALILLLTIILALWIKLFYSSAGPEQLKWVLYPTTALVEAFSAINFLFDPKKGYAAIGQPVVIGPGCAGLNFYVIALCMAIFGFIDRFGRHKLYWFLGFVLITYVVTVLVNAFRIVGGIKLLEFGGNMHFTVSDTLHSAQGTLFYFVFLIAYFVAVRAILNRRTRNEAVC
jgi:exosortase K